MATFHIYEFQGHNVKQKRKSFISSDDSIYIAFKNIQSEHTVQGYKYG